MSDYEVIEVKPHEQVVLVLVQAARLNSTTAAKLEDEVSHAISEAPGLPLVLDLSNVKFAPSVALGALVNLFKFMKMQNRKAFLVGVNRQIRGTLGVTRLDALIQIRSNVADALTQV